MTALPQKADIRSSKTMSALGHKRAQIVMPAVHWKSARAATILEQ
jgi:hypothetical protein